MCVTRRFTGFLCRAFSICISVTASDVDAKLLQQPVGVHSDNSSCMCLRDEYTKRSRFRSMVYVACLLGDCSHQKLSIVFPAVKTHKYYWPTPLPALA